MKRRPQAARLAKAAALALAMIAGAQSAQAATQLFKCVIDKRIVYQQQACPVNAEPAPAAASTPPSPAPPQGTNAAAPPYGLKPASRAASSVPATPR